MPKRLTDSQKKEILDLYLKGNDINNISRDFNFTNTTIKRQLKLLLGDKKFQEVKDKQIKNNKNIKNKNLEKNINSSHFMKDDFPRSNNSKFETNINNQENLFFEIKPVTTNIEFSNQKDISSEPIENVDLPRTVFMIVQKNIELETKLLKEYPEWEFLSDKELNKKTIAIYYDLKVAKRLCNKDQKVIKVPNSEVFKIAAPILTSHGITRIVSPDKLIAL